MIEKQSLNDAVKPLGKIAEIKQGKYLAKNEMAEHRSRENPIPVYGANGIIGWTNKPMYNEGVPLVTCRGSGCGAVLWANGPLWVSNNSMAILPFGNSRRFTYYELLENPPVQFVTGSAQPQITITNLSKRPTRDTPKTQADSITTILQALDDKIELNRRMNATLEAQAQAVFRDWFVDFGPTRARMEGRTPYLPADLWDLFPDKLGDDGLPEGWKNSQLDEYCSLVLVKTHPKDVEEQTPYIGLEHMPRGSIALENWDDAGKVDSQKSVFEKGDILFGKLRPYFHKVGIAPTSGICSTDILVLRPEDGQSAAVTCLTSSNDFVDYAAATSTGTKMPRANWKTLRSYPLAKPSEEIAVCFQKLCEPMLDRIVENTFATSQLSKTRDYLLPRLMSGEVEVDAG